MINVDRNRFRMQSNVFMSESHRANIHNKLDSLSGSEGAAIDKINECFEAYNDVCESFNKVYESTARYLSKAAMNIELCEADNEGS